MRVRPAQSRCVVETWMAATSAAMTSGAGRKVRTPDLRVTRAALCRLSYASESSADGNRLTFRTEPETRSPNSGRPTGQGVPYVQGHHPGRSRFALSREWFLGGAGSCRRTGVHFAGTCAALPLGVGGRDQATKHAALAQRQCHVQRGGARTRNDAVAALVSSLRSCFDDPGHFALSPVEAEGHGGPPPG